MLRMCPPAGRRRALVALGLVAAVGALWASVRPHPSAPPDSAALPPARSDPAARPDPSMLVYNRLTEPIALTLDDTGFTVPAGDSLRLPLPARRPLEAHWAMVRPAAGDGRILGSELEGSIVSDDVRGEVRQVVVAAADGRPRFSPLVVNGTPRRLTVAVVSGRDTTDCGCWIPPGDSLRLGYYPLEPGSGVRVRDPRRAAGQLAVAAAGVDSVTGAVVFRVSSASLTARAASRHSGTRAPTSPRQNPLRTFLPVR